MMGVSESDAAGIRAGRHRDLRHCGQWRNSFASQLEIFPEPKAGRARQARQPIRWSIARLGPAPGV